MDMPIVRMLTDYAQQNNARFHMPGHKGGVEGGDFARELNAVLPFDVTELDFSDNLAQPQGAIAKAQTLYAKLYGADQCYFSTNGSTCGILAFIACCDEIITERASHASVFNALELLGKKAVVINNAQKDGRFLPLTLEQVKQTVKIHPHIKNLLITYPNYYGETCDIKAIYEFCKTQGITLFADGAHGAHFGFSRFLPQSVITHCDACVLSAHKTLPAMTQTALVCVKDGAPAQNIKEKLNVFNSSSPNYLLMASIDFARAYLCEAAERGRDAQTLEYIEKIKALPLDFLPNGDPLRLVLQNTDGFAAERYLRENGVYAEFCDLSRVVFIVSLAEKAQNLVKLKQTLQSMPRFEKKDMVLPQRRECCFEVDLSFKGKTRLVPLAQADGMICARQCGFYPPGVPVFMAGEKIKDAAILEGCGTFGLQDGKIKVFDV